MFEKESQGVQESEAVVAAAKPGKYLTFKLNREVYGLEILKVQEIIGIMPVTRIPRTPHFVRGVINLRGKVIPVIDLRIKFGLTAANDTERTCVIVVQVAQNGHQVTIGTIVDEVSEVLNITREQIEPTPGFGTNLDTAFILGMGKIGQMIVMLLDVDEVLSADELGMVAQSVR